MKIHDKIILIFLFLILFLGKLGSNTVMGADDPMKSFYGHMINPHGQYRVFNLFINVIYDQTPHIDPIQDGNSIWPGARQPGINQSLPVYLKEFMDTEYLPAGGYGSMTRLYRESSFDRLILLGDFMVVNIRQSEIPKTNDRYFRQTKGSFSIHSLVNTAIKYINAEGGLNAIFGHNTISDFDGFTPAGSGLHKPMEANGQIDFIQILTRNTTYLDTTFVHNNDTVTHRLQYGQLRSGQGWGNFKPAAKLLIDGKEYGYDLGTIQCIGDGNITDNPANIIHHEFSHNLFGGNNFHASGGNHYTAGGTNTFFGTEGGYGLMGSYHSSLVSCNGYERWRMHWTNEQYNPQGHLIQAGGVPSDLSKEDGPQAFILRDFVTTGDAIRIKLPYKDEGASNQYIWLENHQVGLNGKLDYLQYALDFFGNTNNPCRHPGTPGIYAYIQVGKDILEGSTQEVFPWNETDNLRILSAEGNWDFKLLPGEYSCVAHGHNRRTELRYQPNPLSGYQDQTTHFFPPDGQDILRRTDGDGIAIKYFSENSDDKDVSYSFYGDNLDAFTGKTFINIGTNPSPVNVTTYYVNQFHGGNTHHVVSDQNTNTSHIYLTGLSIDMEDLGDGTFAVQIKWDDYEVLNDVRWAGNIVLKEQLLVKENKTIELVQSLTPNQIFRDPVSGLFVKPTVMKCEGGSRIVLEQNARLRLSNISTLDIEPGGVLEIGHRAELLVGPGDTLKLAPSSRLIIHGRGKLSVHKDGVISISEGAELVSDRGRRNLKLQRGHIIPAGFADPRDIIKKQGQILP